MLNKNLVKRKIIKIDNKKCIGCGICVNACHEGAIEMIDNKAVLIRDDYCDGLGDCLPTCPVSAISFEEREALEYNDIAVKEHINKRNKNNYDVSNNNTINKNYESCLSQWPIQIKLVPTNANYFKDSNILIAADCTAFAYGNFHNEFIKDRITLIGCPKLDMVDYSEKLMEILKYNDIKTVTVVRMQVPCCSGIENALKNAVIKSKKDISINVVIISPDGKIIGSTF